jgi:hypothetical protein
MTVNASGKGSSNMESDMDMAENSRFKGISDLRTENYSATPYYGIAPYNASIAK